MGEAEGFFLRGVWTLDDIGFTAKALFDLWRFDDNGLRTDMDFKPDPRGGLFAEG